MSEYIPVRNPRLHPSLQNAVSVPTDKSQWTPEFFRKYVFGGDVDGMIADMVTYVLQQPHPSEQPIEQTA